MRSRNYGIERLSIVPSNSTYISISIYASLPPAPPVPPLPTFYNASTHSNATLGSNLLV
jgi:hypothetical protein